MKEPFEPRTIELNQIVSEFIGLLSTTVQQRKIKIIQTLSSTVLPVRGDTVQLQQVFVTLIINGMDAMSVTNGGPREIVVRTFLVPGFAEVSVSDHSSGISPEKFGNLFDPFFTTKQNGMGIGLSISRTIVEAHGGRIWAENRQESGAIFNISLPRSSA